MNTIKFNHNYNKLWNQKEAVLVMVSWSYKKTLPDNFIEYDTTYDGGQYELNDEKMIYLLFIGEDGIPFTSLRAFSESQLRHCQNQVGEYYEIEIVES